MGDLTERVAKLQALYNVVAEYGKDDAPAEQRSMAQQSTAAQQPTTPSPAAVDAASADAAPQPDGKG
jgi:hypothetical protein